MHGIKLHPGGTETNSGSVYGAKYGVEIYGGLGTVTNLSDAKIYATGKNGIGVDLLAGGAVTNDASGTIYGAKVGVSIKGGIGKVTNGGEIFVGYSTGSQEIVWLRAGGSVTNQKNATIKGESAVGVAITGGAGAVSNAGIIGGLRYGVEFSGGNGMVTNAGTMLVTAVGPESAVVRLGTGGVVTNQKDGTIIGEDADYGVKILKGAGSVTNAGTITDTPSSGFSHAANISLGLGGVLTNQKGATVGGSAYFGVDIFGEAGAVTNAGSISGVDYGVFIKGGKGAVTNSGAIAGKTASVAFAGPGVNTLTLRTGSTLTGAAEGSTAKGATNALIFEGSGTADNAFEHFNALTVSKGASWTLGGSSAIGAILVRGVMTVTGALTTKLTLKNGDAIFESAFGGDAIFAGKDELALSTTYGGTIFGFGKGDKIDFLNDDYAKGDHAVISGGAVKIETAANNLVVEFRVAGSYTSSDFSVGKDASNHVLVAGVHAAFTSVAVDPVS